MKTNYNKIAKDIQTENINTSKIVDNGTVEDKIANVCIDNASIHNADNWQITAGTLNLGETKENSKDKELKGTVIKGLLVNVRRNPSSNSDILYIVDYTNELSIQEIIDGWAHVRVDNIEGYIMEKYILILERGEV